MLIDLLSVVKTDNYTVERTVRCDSEEITTSFGVFPIKHREEFLLEITHLKDHELLIKGNTTISVEIPCDRCLGPALYNISVEIDKDVKLKEVAHDVHMIEEQNYIDGYNLDVDKLLYNEILIGWPMKILCSDTCKGVCNVCGQNLNQGICNCEDTSLDPRMSVVRDIFKNFKEV